jgi:DNA-binding transcriptional MerR regulator
MASQRPGGKSAAAFRTISEVSDELEVPQHVLRFWETKFPQVKPLKRGGGRRYYRPEDVELLRRIRALLYGEGYTIKGVQRLLRENGGKASAEAKDAVKEATKHSPPGASAVAAAGAAKSAPAGAGRAPLQRLLRDLNELRELLRRAGF